MRDAPAHVDDLDVARLQVRVGRFEALGADELDDDIGADALEAGLELAHRRGYRGEHGEQRGHAHVAAYRGVVRAVDGDAHLVHGASRKQLQTQTTPNANNSKIKFARERRAGNLLTFVFHLYESTID